MATNSKNILIVDDEPPHRMLIKRAVKALGGLTILEADSTLKATSVINRELDRLALAVVDFNLGGHSGLEIVELLRSLRSLSELPVIVLSTSGLDADVEASYIAGASCYLVKATQPEQFTSELQSALKFFLRP